MQAGKDCKTLGEGEVVPLRFERGLREPKTLVLPLHHGTSTKGHFCSLQCKSTTSFPNNQILAHKKCSVQTKVDVNVGYTPSAEHKTQAPNANTKRKHQTLTLMGATRLASGKIALNKGSQIVLISLLSVSPCFNFPDARRVAPISACVGCLRLVLALGVSVWCLRWVLALGTCVGC